MSDEQLKLRSAEPSALSLLGLVRHLTDEVERCRATPTGLPYLRPEVVLLYKAKQPRAADERDAAAAIPLLSRHERTWLAEAIARDTPTHPWLSRLRCP